MAIFEEVVDSIVFTVCKFTNGESDVIYKM